MKVFLHYLLGILIFNYSIPLLAQQHAQAPAAWKWGSDSLATEQAATVSDQWWHIFQDPLLDSLEQAGLTHNLDLRAMLNRVEESRLRIKVAESYWLPSVRLSPGANTQSLAPNRPLALRLQEGAQLERFILNAYQIPLEVSYEVDLWSRVRNQVRASNLLLESTEAEYRAVQLTVSTEIARTYLLLRAADTEKDVLQRGIRLRDSTLNIVEARYTAGLANEMDVQRAETEVASARFQLEAVNRSRAEIELSMAVLLGVPPHTLSIPEGTLADELPVIPEVAPTDLTFRRPDLVQSERLVAAASTQIAVSKTALLPRLSLIGSAGLISRDINTLFNANSGTYLLGGSVSIPIYEGNRNRNNIAIAEQQVQSASLNYQQRVLTASREVEEALANLQILSRQFTVQQQALQSAQKTRRYARELYLRGLTSFLEAIDAERTALELERQAVNVRGQQALYTVALVKALGGSW